MKGTHAIFRPATEEERALAAALGRCTFAPATFSKRFAREISAQVSARGEITDAQARRLRIQAYIFRRQMPPELVPANPPEGYETPKQRAAAAMAGTQRCRALPPRSPSGQPAAGSHAPLESTLNAQHPTLN